MNVKELHNTQLKLMKATVCDSEWEDIKNSNSSIFSSLDIQGFERFRSFTINSRMRRFVTVLPRTLEYVGTTKFIDLINRFFERYIFKGQSVFKDLEFFGEFITRYINEDKLSQYVEFEITKYKVSNTPYSSPVIKLDFNFHEPSEEGLAATYYLFVQNSYLENTKIYEITQEIYLWLKNIVDLKDPSVDYKFFSPAQASLNEEYNNNVELITSLNIPNLLIGKARMNNA